MNKILLTFITVFAYLLSNAQDNPYKVLIKSNTLNLIEDQASPIEISSDGNFTLSGVFYSETSILIKTSINKSIKLIPKDPVFSTSGSPVLVDPPVTSIKIKTPGGIQPPTSKSTINFYPNPVQNDLTFTLTGKLANAYNIYDKTGLLKISQSITPTNTATINVSSLTAGNYILKLNLDNGQQLSIQFIKN